MKIPFVIDNREHTLADVLNDLLNQFVNKSIDIATAYFTARGFQLIKGGLENSDFIRDSVLESIQAKMLQLDIVKSA